MKYDKINGISSTTVERVTGKSWSEWIVLLDKEKCGDKSHKEIAKMVYQKYLSKSGWWSQMVTVGYEYAKGKRVVGQTETQGFEIGVQKMLPISQERLWKFINSKREKELWLGKDIEHEIRTIKEGERIRLKWKLKKWTNTSTLQIILLCSRNSKGKTNLNFHQEKLVSTKQRDEMREYWKKVVGKIENELKIN